MLAPLGLVAVLVLGLATVFVLAPPAAVASDGPSEIRAADVVVDGKPAGLRPAVRIAAPAASASAGPTPTAANMSTCRGDLPSPDMSVSIPSIGYSCPVYAGGQALMDSGAVTRADPGELGFLARGPGDGGTLWLSAHRTTHGGAFAAVPEIADGELVTVTQGSRTATYSVVGRVLVNVVDDRVVDATGVPTSAATLDAITRADRGGNGAPRLLLQTCEGATMRWMIYADLVTG